MVNNCSSMRGLVNKNFSSTQDPFNVYLKSPTSILSFKTYLEQNNYPVTFMREDIDIKRLCQFFGICESKLKKSILVDSNNVELLESEQEISDQDISDTELDEHDKEYIDFQKIKKFDDPEDDHYQFIY